MPRRWVVISVDGLATAALGAFGSSWNETPTIDRMAAHGIVWDRAICTSDSTNELLKSLWSQPIGESDTKTDFISAWRKLGRVELFVSEGVEATQLTQLADQLGFDQCTVVETSAGLPANTSEELSGSRDEIEEAALAQLWLPVLERLGEVESGVSSSPSSSSKDWSVLWVHDDTFTRRWDAPRWLFPVEEEEEDEEPVDELEWALEDFEAASSVAEPEDDLQVKPPPLFDSSEVPHFKLTPDAHPDLVTSWMQTYGCQVRLLDRMLQWLVDAIESSGESIGVALIGTSGFSLGQNGWIGHRAGPIRTPQVHVPIVLFDGLGVGVRLPGLRPIENVTQFLMPPAETGESCRIAPHEWAVEDASDAMIETRSARAERVLTTPQWFFVQEASETRLFLKPDDRDDMNDVATRCRDVVDQMLETPR